MELANLQFSVESRQVDDAGRSLDQLAQKADRAQRATDGLSGGSKRLSGATSQMLASIERAVQELVALQRAQQQFTIGLAEGAAAAIRESQALNTASGAMNTYAGSATKAAAAQSMVAATSRRAANDNKLAAHEVANLGRQFADLGVMAAMGMNPLMIFISQGPQIADIFATARSRGVGLGEAMAQIGGIIRPFVPLLVGVGAAAAAAFGGAALAARAVNKDVGDLSKSMGLTEAQMKRLKEEGVETGVTIGDVFKGTFNYIAGAVGEVLEPVAKWFSKLFDDMTRWAVAGVKGIVGALVGGFNAIKAVWKMLPAAMGDVAISAANAVIQAIESMINKAMQAYNKALPLIRGLMLATGNIGGALGLRQAGDVSLGRIDNPNAGAASAAMDAGKAAFDEGRKAGEGWVDGVRKGLKDAWLKAAEDRIKAAAGDAGRSRSARERAGPKGPTAEDMAEQFAQRRAEIERQIEHAKGEELQAQLALTVEIRERANIEREIARQQATVKAAQLKVQLERIKNDDKLTEAAKQELAAMLMGVAIRQGNVARMQQQAIDEQEARDLAKEEFALKRSGLENEADLLEAQQGLAQYEFQREAGAVKLLKIRQQLEKLAIQEALASEKLTKVQRDILEARLGQLDAIHSVQLEAAAVTAEQRFNNVSNALQGVADAIRSKDWFAAVQSLFAAIGQLRNAFSKPGWKGEVGAGKIGAIAGIANMAGQAIGGTAGAVLSGGASGAMAGLTLAPLLGIAGPVGAIAGAILGGIFGGIGADKQKKAQKAEEERRRREEAARVEAERAQQARELEIMLMQESGDVLGALAAQRQLELDSIHATNRALAEQVQAMKEAKAAQEQYNALFLSENERLLTVAQDTGKALAQLGFTGVTSMEQFKKLADGIDRSTASGAQLFSALMSLGPAFAQVAGYIASVQGAAAAMTPYQAAQAGVSAAQGAVTAAEAKVAAAQAALQQAIQAQTQQNNEAAQAAQRVAQQFRGLADSLRKYRESLNMGEAARLSPEAEYQAARAAFDALQGKTDAQSLEKLQDASERYREASEAYYGTSLGYFADLERIKAAVEFGAKHADKQATAAEAQVAALEAANRALAGINGSVMSVEDAQRDLLLAQDELRLAQEALAAAEATFQAQELALLAQIRDAISGVGANAQPSQGAWNAEGYLAKNPDVRDHWFTLTQKQRDAEGVHTIEAWARKHWDGIGRSEGRSFATGGSFTVGGVGGPDSQFMPLWLSPGEMVDVRRPGPSNDNGDVVAAIEGLGERLERVERQLAGGNEQRGQAAIATLNALGEVREELVVVKRKLTAR